LGYNPTEITGQSFTCFVHPDDAPGLLVNFERTLSSDLKPHEFRALAEDGSTHYMRVSCKPISEQDRLTGLTGIMSDITVNKRADAVLKESEEMYRTLVRTTTDAVSVTDLQGNITEVSGRTVELHGYGKPEDLIGRSIFELIVPEQHRRALANFKKVLKDGFVRSLEYTFVRKDGTQFIGELDAALIKDASDDPKAMIAATRNITERKRAEKALRVSEKRFRDIVENASEWIWEVNAQGVYTYSSPVVKHILGYEPDEILGKHFYDLFCPEKREELKSEAFGIFRTKRPFREFINCNVHKNGQIVWISTNGVPILSETGEAVGYRGTDTDITECKLAQDQLAVEREQMVRTLRSIDDGVIVTDLDGKVVMVNSAAEALTGWTEDDALGRDLAEVFIAGAPQASATTGAADRILEPGRESALAERAILVSRGGERRTVAYSSARIRNKENMPSGLVIIFSDISMSESEDRPPSPA
jgi:PAS domain S-box-containing protein